MLQSPMPAPAGMPLPAFAGAAASLLLLAAPIDPAQTFAGVLAVFALLALASESEARDAA